MNKNKKNSKNLTLLKLHSTSQSYKKQRYNKKHQLNKKQQNTVKKQYKHVDLQLNEKQKLAVELLDSPVIVLAGPGTGKTKLLTSKIAYILQNTDAKPDEILALTFTESAASNMKARLSKLVGSAAYDVNIFTFHGLANYLINYYEDEYFQEYAGFRIISELEQVQILKNILSDSSLKFKHLIDKVNPYYQIANIKKQIDAVKRENITLAKFKDLINIETQVLELLPKKSTKSADGLTGKYKKQRDFVLKLQDFYVIYQEYEKKLQELKLLDFADLINIVLEKMDSNQEFLQTLQERFQYILVDEYQDTNTSQNKLVFKIAEYWQDKANILVVGDDDQAIFRFQGASVKNLVEFVQTFKSAKPIVLDTNYRSVQQIIDPATDVAQKINMRLNKFLQIEKHFKAGNKDLIKNLNKQADVGVYFDEFENQLDELNFIVQKIKKLLDMGVNPGEIAILVRQNDQLDNIMHVLKLNKLKFIKYGGIDIFERPLIQQFLDYLRLIISSDNLQQADSLFIRAMHFKFNNIDAGLILKLKRAFNKFKQDVKQNKLYEFNTSGADSSVLQKVLQHVENLTFFDFLQNKALHKYLEAYDIDLGMLQPIYEFQNKIVDLSSALNEYNLLRFVHKVFKESGLADYILSLDSKLDEISAFGVLFEHIKTLVLNNPDISVQEFLDIVTLFKQYNLRLESFSYYVPEDAIKLITVHKAKGLEFDYVFLPFISEDFWESKRSRAKLLNLPDYVYSVQDFAQNAENIAKQRAEFLDLSPAKQKALKPDEKVLKEDDERRAFYVGLTRARYGVFLTYSKNVVKNGKLVNQNPTRFVLDIQPQNITKTSHEQQVNVQDDILMSLLEPSPTYYLGITVNDLDFIKQTVQKLNFSATMLMTFLDDSQEFYLRYVLRLPTAPALHLSYGNAYHYALQKTFAYYKKLNKMPDYKYALEYFQKALANEPINLEEYKKLVDKAKLELFYYFRDRLQNYMYYPLYLESNALIKFNNHSLVGKLDKVEIVDKNNSGLEQYVQIIDYKTGQAETLNAVLGKTKGAKMLRGFITKKAFQLYYYKLIFDNSPKLNQNGKYIAKWGGLDFTKVSKNQPYLPKIVTIEFDPVFYEDFKQFLLNTINEIHSLEWVKKLNV